MSSIISCCELCPGVNNCIPAEVPKCNHYTSGLTPLESTIVFVGEAPGKEEDKRKRVFVGKTGQELEQHYLPLAGLRRENVYITNAIKCLPVGHGGKLDLARDKDLGLLACCSSHSLYSELEETKPRLIVPMGAFACYAIDPDIQLDLQHGMPIETAWGTVFPMYHPAGGIHQPKHMIQIRTDFYRLGKYLKGKLRIPKDEFPHPKYNIIK